MGSLVKEVASASCDGGSKAHDLDYFISPDFPLPVTEGAVPTGEEGPHPWWCSESGYDLG